MDPKPPDANEPREKQGDNDEELAEPKDPNAGSVEAQADVSGSLREQGAEDEALGRASIKVLHLATERGAEGDTGLELHLGGDDSEDDDIVWFNPEDLELSPKPTGALGLGEQRALFEGEHTLATLRAESREDNRSQDGSRARGKCSPTSPLERFCCEGIEADLSKWGFAAIAYRDSMAHAAALDLVEQWAEAQWMSPLREGLSPVSETASPKRADAQDPRQPAEGPGPKVLFFALRPYRAGKRGFFARWAAWLEGAAGEDEDQSSAGASGEAAPSVLGEDFQWLLGESFFSEEDPSLRLGRDNLSGPRLRIGMQLAPRRGGTPAAKIQTWLSYGRDLVDAQAGQLLVCASEEQLDELGWDPRHRWILRISEQGPQASPGPDTNVIGVEIFKFRASGRYSTAAQWDPESGRLAFRPGARCAEPE